MQYQRFTPKLFGETALATGSDPQIAQFGSALANTFLGTTDPATIQALSAWSSGFIGAVTPSEQFPPLPETTGVLKVFSYLINMLYQQGVPVWDSGTTYYTNNFCSKNGIIYISTSDDNTGNDPETDTTNWKDYVNSLISLDGQWIYKKQLISTDTAYHDGIPYTYDLSSYLGVSSDSTVQYELLFAQSYYCATSNGSIQQGIIYSDVISDYGTVVDNREFGSMLTSTYGRTTGFLGTIPVKTKLYMRLMNTMNIHCLIAVGYRRLGTNQ
jgi:hypothetical protein